MAFTKICTYYYTNVACSKCGFFFPGGFCIAKAINNFPKGMFFLSTETLTLLLPSPCLKSVPFLHMSAAWYNSWLTTPPPHQCILYLDGTKRKLIAINPKGRTKDLSITPPLSGKLCAFLTSQFTQACLTSSDLILCPIPSTSVLQYYLEYWTLGSSYGEGAGKAIGLCLQSLLDFLSHVCVWDT